ncbi:MAG TPA: hypothetical protein VFJ85_16040 [Acidimicrobiales bacterium]|nr:hypothetical protein [Acidimicrobiales bacterium]
MTRLDLNGDDEPVRARPSCSSPASLERKSCCILREMTSCDDESDARVRRTPMARTLVDINEEALAAAAAERGMTTKVDTVNRAPAEIAAS